MPKRPTSILSSDIPHPYNMMLRRLFRLSFSSLQEKDFLRLAEHEL
jgi:hypothetical protein